jgi:small-conductance mechanosensitive channel
LSSSTIFGNAIAGLQIRFVAGRRLRIGDYIRAEKHIGRVTEMGILATIIQTENRDLTALPNLWIVGRPITVVQPSGTIVSTTVTLGYDVPRSKATAVMVEAAERVGLSSPFVRIEALGNFSVSYKVAGVLTDVMRLLETFSQLRGSVLDALHAAGIEIVSPNLMSSRAFPPTKQFIPEPGSATDSYEPIGGDEVVFDEASAAAERENQREAIRKALKEARTRRDAALNPVKRKPLTAEVERLEKTLEALED